MSSFVQVVNVSVFWRLGHAHLDDVQWKRLRTKICCQNPAQYPSLFSGANNSYSHAIGSGVWGHTTADIKFGEIKFQKKHKKFMLRILKDHFMKIPPANWSCKTFFVLLWWPCRLLVCYRCLSMEGFARKAAKRWKVTTVASVALLRSDWRESCVGVVWRSCRIRGSKDSNITRVFGDFTKQEVSELAGFSRRTNSLKHRDWFNLQIFSAVCWRRNA